MPRYEYKCEKCGHLFEEIMRWDDPVPPCPKCHTPEQVKKQISLPSAHAWGCSSDGAMPRRGK